jgi:hypothetical protein
MKSLPEHFLCVEGRGIGRGTIVRANGEGGNGERGMEKGKWRRTER